MKRLVVAPKPLPTESLPGYVLRLTQANGYPTSTYILADILKDPNQSTLCKPDATPLVARAGITEEQAARLTLRSKTKGTVQFLGQELVTSDLRLNSPKVCPCCIAETGACEALWDLAMVTACPIHRIALLDRCEACEKPLRWVRSKIGQCKCGADLTVQGSRERIPDTVTDLMAAFRAMVYRDPDIQSLPQQLSHLGHLDIYGLSKLTWVLGEVLQELSGGKMHPRAKRRMCNQLEGVARLLSEWPRCFQQFLEESYGQMLAESNPVPKFHTTFGWAKTRLAKNLRGRGGSVRFLIDQVYVFAANYWSRDKLARTDEAHNALPAQMRWGTIQEASQITGLMIRTLIQHIDDGEVPIRRTAEGRTRRNLMIDLNWARSRLATAHPPLMIRNAAKELGLSNHTLRHLREQGTYQVRYHTEYKRSYSVEDVQLLGQRLKDVTETVLKSAPKGAVTLQTVFRHHVTSAEDKAKLIKALLSRKILAVGRLGAHPSQIVLPMDSVLNFVRQTSARLPDSVSRSDAALQLSTGDATLAALVDNGYLSDVRKRGRSQILTASLDAFRREYHLLSSFCRRAGITSAVVLVRARRTNFPLISVTTDRFKTWMFRQSDLDGLDRLVSEKQHVPGKKRIRKRKTANLAVSV